MHHTHETNHHSDLVLNISHETLRELLELVEYSAIEIQSTKARLSITQILDALDNEFLLGELLGSDIEISLNGQCRFYQVASDEPDQTLALACTEILFSGRDPFLSNGIRRILTVATHH